MEGCIEIEASRPAVKWFGGLMEMKLRKNDHKGDASSVSQDYLYMRMIEEMRELEASLQAEHIDGMEVAFEAADVANFAMMVACNALRPGLDVRDAGEGIAGAKRLDVAPGYEILAGILDEALAQAQSGKGKQRHACDEPFKDQEICQGARKCGPGAMAYQVRKKILESIRLLDQKGVAAAEGDVLGAIVYAAAQLIVMREMK